MAGKLSKVQRMHARERLIVIQKGRCANCGEKIENLIPDVPLSENWRRAVLYKKAGKLHLGCQPCATDIITKMDVRIDKELAEVEKLISAR